MFRKFYAWLNILALALVAQTLTVVLTGIATGYLMSIYQWQSVLDEDYVVLSVLGVIGFFFGAGVTSMLITGSTLYHLYRLSLGGPAIAESLGGVPFDEESAPGTLPALPEITRQVAAMFGVPAPTLYWLPQEDSMNAFAAGKSPQTAVIGVTRGMRRMGTSQLRGIVAHEMAHICNGDMQHNMRMLAVVLGLKSVQATSHKLINLGIRWLNAPSRYWRIAMFQVQWGIFCILLGLVCYPMGIFGALIGSLMLAFTNRRRELRADRIATAILGDPAAIADALKMILGDQVGSRLSNPQLRAFGHVMFAQADGVSGGFLSSHPTLHRRVYRQQKNWDGLPLFEADLAADVAPHDDQDVTDERPAAARQTEILEIGPLTRISPEVLSLFQDATACIVTLPALLLFEPQHRRLIQHAQGGRLAGPVESLWEVLEGLRPDERVALIDLNRITLSKIPRASATEVLALIDEITDYAGDRAWGLHAWRSLLHADVRGLPKLPRAKIGKLTPIFRDMVELISVVSVVAEDGGLTDFRFHRAWGRLGLPQAGVLPADVLAWPDLEEALRKAVQTPSALRMRIAEACLLALTADGNLDATQAAMVRYLGAILGQPERRLLPGRVTLSM